MAIQAPGSTIHIVKIVRGEHFLVGFRNLWATKDFQGFRIRGIQWGIRTLQRMKGHGVQTVGQPDQDMEHRLDRSDRGKRLSVQFRNYPGRFRFPDNVDIRSHSTDLSWRRKNLHFAEGLGRWQKQEENNSYHMLDHGCSFRKGSEVLPPDPFSNGP